MNPVALIAFLVCALALLTVPRRLAPAALLAGSIYMTMGQGIEIGGINLPVYRMLLIVGVSRVLMKGERLAGWGNQIDRIMIAFGLWLVFAGCFHDWSRYGPVYAAGIVFNIGLVYFLIRAWCTDLDEVRFVVAIIAVLLVPIALEMLLAQQTGKNLFSVFGGVPEYASVREGKIRAQGPFMHAILAGTVGAVCIPLFVGLLKNYRTVAIVGMLAGVAMVFASASSGPVMSLMAAVGALSLWRFKDHLGKARLGAVLLYLLLMVVMNRPPYYLMGEIDISGGSTGWHRANLIDMTLQHFSEWWLFGTDATRHWMPAQGVAVDPLHTDITNYYISFAVAGGLLAVVMLVAMLWIAFRWVGKVIDLRIERQPEQAFMIWCFGASLFSHAVTSLSVAYFDQSMLFFWLSLAVISSAYASAMDENDVKSTHWDEAETIVMEPSACCTQSNFEWRRQYRERVLNAYHADALDPRLSEPGAGSAADKPAT